MIIELPPGVVDRRSLRSNQANWSEVNLVRWSDGDMFPVGGWEAFAYPDTASPIRNIHKWTSNDGHQITAYLCESHCYIDMGDSVLVDITPVGGISPPPIAGAGGYGDSDYGTDEYGTTRDAANRTEVATPAYTLENWGEELRAMTSSDGRLLSWSPATPSSKLVPVSGAPTGNHSFVVTPERHIILFGASGVRQQFVWCDQENDTNWVVSTTSKAGGFYVEPASPIMAAKPAPSGVVMFTTRAAYYIQYVGLPYVYSYDKVTDCPPPYSPHSVSEYAGGVIWASINGFWIFDGTSVSPLSCPVWDWVKKRIDVLRSRFNSAIVHTPSTFEVMWFFTSIGSNRNDVYVSYNYRDKVWSMGKLGRSCGVATPNNPNPVMADGVKVYKHEKGWLYTGAPELPWAETFTLNTARGSVMTTIHQMLPEVSGDTSKIGFRFAKLDNPSNPLSVVYSGVKPVRDNGYVDVRETARDFRLRVETLSGGEWSLGPVDMDTRYRGKK